MAKHKYIDTNTQINKLLSQGLNISDIDAAKQILDTYGFYNVINGYREPFLTTENNTKKYVDGISFEQIFSLYQFDTQLRHIVMSSMTAMENHLKAVLANILAENYGVDQNDYLDKKNYKYRQVRDPRYGFLATRQKIEDLCSSGRNPVNYYRNKYGVVPPWILFKIVTFGQIVTLSKYLKAPLKEELCKRMLNLSIYKNNNAETCKRFLYNSFALFLEYRNLSAHGGRVYNHVPKSEVNLKKAKRLRLSLLKSALACYQYREPFNMLDKSLNDILNDYCHKFPDDKTRIARETGLVIKQKVVVWIGKNNIYHVDPRCSGAKSLRSVDFTDDIKVNFRPCKKCASILK